MKKYKVSVIIPTYNRCDKLLNCLRFLNEQNFPQEDFEIIVVNDGSDDNTESKLKKIKYKNLSFYTQKNSGQGIARNLGIEKAKGEILIFIGDDIYPQKNFLKTHYEFHKNTPANYAALGLTEWYPKIKITAFMNWLVSGGPQFAYFKLKDKHKASFWYFYTSNISLKKSLLNKHKFDRDFKSYGWEDIELAYRLTKKENLEIIYLKKALAYHDHEISEASLKNRMIAVGKSLHIFQKKHKELKLIPRNLKKLLLSLIGSKILVFILKYLPGRFFKRLYWYSLSKRYFMQGIKSV